VSLARDITVGLLWLAVVFAVLATGFYFVSTANGSTVCLSKSEARQLWPKRHIYWYSKRHCWSNRRGPPRGLRIDPVDPVFPKHSKVAKIETPKLASAAIATSAPHEDEQPPSFADSSGNGVSVLRSFEDRWRDQPWIGVILRDASGHTPIPWPEASQR
jgi:hypothetical protein